MTRHTQSCPTCGRRTQIPSAMLGRMVACSHCHVEFLATLAQPSETPSEASQIPALDPLMQRVERVLARTAN